jgi:nucleoside-diphosphate-sugar epimerase
MMSDFWRGKRVLVTGGSGFIGSHVVEMLVEKGAKVTVTTFSIQNPPNLTNLQSVKDKVAIFAVDLTRLEDCEKVCRNQEVVLNLAHIDGSTAFKQKRPAFIFRQNMLITLNMLEAACKGQVDRFLVMSSAEVYRPEAPIPTPESEGLKGLPDRLTDGYAWSKRMSEFAAEFFAREYGLKVAIARPSNVYGPRDYLDPKRGRVIPMFIKRIFESEGSLIIWGTGDQVRTFLYVEDLAQGLLDLVERYPRCDPVNLGGDEEITIKGLAELIVRLSGKEVQITYDPEKPAGPLRRVCDITKAKQLIDFVPTVPLEAGLERTIRFFREQGFS